VVGEDRPQGLLLYVNEAARRAGVLPGQRFATVLGLSRDLRAGTASLAQIDANVREIAVRLQNHSPAVEPDAAHPGVAWLDASGFERIQPSLRKWADGIASDLSTAGFESTVVVGFTRFGTYAVARSGRGVKVFGSAAEEDAAARAVPLRRLDVEPRARERLSALGVRSVGDVLKLPAASLRQRFGDELYHLRRFAAGDLFTPLQAMAHEAPLERTAELEAPDSDASRLLFLVKRLLDSLLAEMAGRSLALRELLLRLLLDDHREYEESLRPAAPTLDSAQLIGLVRLRLETLRLTSGVVELKVVAQAMPATVEQVKLFRSSERDLESAQRAFARLRAEFGEGVVVRASLREGHLPSARFAWEPLATLPEKLARPRDVLPRPLVRRIHARPIALPPRPRHEPDGWLLRGLEHGRVDKLSGPYVLSGGWWSRDIHRQYYFAETDRGELLWIYYDRRRRRFFLEGDVE
jgi:protein ImuB